MNMLKMTDQIAQIAQIAQIEEEEQTDFKPRGEHGFRVFRGKCFACNKVCNRTERLYRGYLSFPDHELKFVDHNFGETVPATGCCLGTLCTSCARKESVNCSFCIGQTTAIFPYKDPEWSWFSKWADCPAITNWFDKLEDFERVKETMGEKFHEFFLWLKDQRRCCPDYYWWHILCLENRITKDLIKRFEESQQQPKQ